MSKQLICSFSLFLLLIAGRASAITVTTATGNGADTYLANDNQSGLGTNGPDTTHGAEVRMRAFRQLADTRSKTGYIRFDITGIAGDMSGATLTFDATYLKGAAKVVQVYGLIDGDGDLWDESMVTYNTAPGVIPNPPTTLGNCVLDMAKVTLLGTITAPAAGPAYPVTFSSSPTELPLASFLDADTNGLVTFLFVGTDNEGEIASKEHETFNPPTLNLPNAGMRPKTSATCLKPADGAEDVHRDVVLSWTPGALAAKHNVYLGTSLADVTAASATDPLGVLVSLNQDATSYDRPSHLAFEQTYYWRIDEVDAPPDATVYGGSVWSFTVEPFARKIEGIMAKASSSDASGGPENTINGSGLDENGRHSTLDKAMWLSAKDGPQPTWIQYEFDRTYKLHEMWVWNYNIAIETAIGLGFKDVTVEYSIDGTDWTVLGDRLFEQGTGQDAYAHNTTVPFDGVAAKFVRLTAVSKWGEFLSQYGLSEVRFFYIPTHPVAPEPAAGAVGVEVDALLSWRGGREAASHQVYLSTEQDTVANGTAPADTAATSSYDPGPLDLGTTYFWKVSEVNDAETPGIWPGDLWDFTTREYLVVDDFESYNDEENQGTRIYETWIDGWTNKNGSTVGNWDPPFAEQTIVNGGEQSMPVDYNNIDAPFYSEVERTWDTAQDWTLNGADTLVLYFRGHRTGFVESAPGVIAMSGTGTDIFGVADQFRFAFKQLSGNGTIIAKVDSIENTDPWAMAGVMIRENLEPGSRFAAVVATPGNGVRFRARLLTAGDATSDTSVATAEQMALRAPVWIKLERSGSSFSCSYSTDGTKWTAMSWNPQTITMAGTVYIGLAVTSHNAGVVATGEFSDVSLTGATGSWEQAAIGVAQPANDQDQLYVALRDKANHLGTVKHTEADAVLLDTWQEWRIPLADFSSAGVNTAAVKTMYIGVGDRQNPVKAGAGKLYIDDIGVGHPAAGSP